MEADKKNSCTICDIEFANDEKLNKHFTTKRHLINDRYFHLDYDMSIARCLLKKNIEFKRYIKDTHNLIEFDRLEMINSIVKNRMERYNNQDPECGVKNRNQMFKLSCLIKKCDDSLKIVSEKINKMKRFTVYPKSRSPFDFGFFSDYAMTSP